ncbi:SusC/RagA family TonB-linked outer membrane protein [Labilibaculum euxinus]
MKKLFLIIFCIFLEGMQIVNAQTKSIKGTVIGQEDGVAIPGVSVSVKGTTIGTVTNINGKFQLQAPENASVLTFSFIGMKTEEVPISGTIVDAVLKANVIGVDEVMVVAYGTATKGTFTGSAAQVNSDKIELRPITNISNAIEGVSPGIQVDAGSGQPGSGQSIRVRGFGSYSASNAPLYVVDGAPYSGDISSLNANDIESITVLKDAASTALYGNKAANGVIMVTTKKGKKEGGQLSLNASVGLVSRSQPEFDRINAFDYYPIMWEAYRNSNAIPGVDSDADVVAANYQASASIYNELGYNPFTVGNGEIVGTDGKINPNAQYLGKYGEDLDWLDAISRTGKRQNYDINYEGASDKADYYASIGYMNETGYILNSDYERFSGRAKVNYQATNWFKTGFNLSASKTASNMAQISSTNSSSFVNPIRFTRGIGPIYPVHQIDPNTGKYVLNDEENLQFDLNDNRPGGASSGRHIVAEILWNSDLDETTNLGAKTYAELKLTKDLTFTANASFDQRNFYNSTYKNEKVGDGAPGGSASRTYTRKSSSTMNQLLNYTKRINKHSIKALAAHESYNYEYNYFYGSRVEQISDGNSELINFVTTSNLKSYVINYKTESYFGQLSYDYDYKYFLSASYRTDGSSRFAKENRWGDFWSVGFGWRIDQEKFIKDLSFINFLKLRGSYGEVGNDNLGTDSEDYYAYQALYSLGHNNQSEQGIIQKKLEATSLLWESNNSFDIALEFGFFKKLFGSIEFYHRISDNLLFDVPLPLSSGLKSQSKNVGTMFNQGIEISVEYDVIKNAEFNWNISANVSTLKNEFTKLPGAQPDKPAEIINGSKKLMVGHSIYDYWLKQWYGVDPADGATLYIANDATAASVRTIDGIALTTDTQNAKYDYSGTAIPDFFGSVSNTFTYKNFELSALFTYSVGGKILDYNYKSIMSSGSYGSGLSTDILKRWQKPGDITDVPRMDVSQTSNFDATSSRWLTNASYLNLRNVNLSYKLPSSLLGNSGISSAVVYVSGENLGLLNARKGMNIQQDFDGTTSNGYTPSRIISLGVNVKF